MKHLVALTLVIAAFAGAGCKSDSNPLFPIRDTIWVLDSTGLKNPARLSGRVTLQNDCQRESNHAGVLVTIIATGETTLTNDSGDFSFSKYRPPTDGNKPVLTFSKQGYYTHTAVGFDPRYKVDSHVYVMKNSLFRHHRYIAQFTTGPLVDSAMLIWTKDTLVFNDEDVLIKKKIVIDTSYEYYYRFGAVGVNESGQRTSLAQVLPMVTRTPNYDHLDRSNLLSVGSMNAGYPFGFMFSNDQLFRYHGFKRGDTVYVAMAASGECMTGWTPGLEKPTPIPVVLR